MDYSTANTAWVLLDVALVFFMQTSFATVKTGFTRAKSAGNIIMKNLMDFVIDTPLFWLTDLGIIFGGTGAPMGGLDPLVRGDHSAVLLSGVPLSAFLIFQTIFCAMAAAIVSRAMIERTKFISYYIYSAVISAVVCPVSDRWIWGDGWLAQMGFYGLAGSTAVHMYGGVTALIGARILGPCIGKYDKDGNPEAILDHSLTLGALGVFILWFCWFSFNGCFMVTTNSDATVYSVDNIFVTTDLATATVTVATMVIAWVRYKELNTPITLSGSLAGLITITAGYGLVTPMGTFFIGLIAVFVVVFGVEFIGKVYKIDNPVGATEIHEMCGATGTLLTGVFATEGGLVHDGGIGFLMTQFIGIVAVIAWATVIMPVTLNVLRHTTGLRASWEEETKELDATEHNLTSSYADSMPMVFMGRPQESEPSQEISMEKSVTVEHSPKSKPASTTVKLTKIVMVLNQTRFVVLKDVLSQLGVTDMIIIRVMGCDTQKGRVSYYRDMKTEEVTLLPKVELEVVMSRIPVEDVVATAKKVLYTGDIRNRKLFTYGVENVIKVRTDEQGSGALQGK